MEFFKSLLKQKNIILSIFMTPKICTYLNVFDRVVELLFSIF